MLKVSNFFIVLSSFTAVSHFCTDLLADPGLTESYVKVDRGSFVSRQPVDTLRVPTDVGSFVQIPSTRRHQPAESAEFPGAVDITPAIPQFDVVVVDSAPQACPVMPTETLIAEETLAPLPVSFAFHEPLVSVCPEGAVVSPTFIQKASDIADMVHLSYGMVKGREHEAREVNDLLEKYLTAGWRITGFGGFSGNSGFDPEQYDACNRDLAGFVAFNPGTGEARVIFHGSQDRYDWKDNLDSQLVVAREVGLNLPGQVQRAYAKRYLSAQKDIYALLRHHYESLSPEDQRKFYIVVSGHSLGGGVATLTFADLAINFFGAGYNNASQNLVQAIAFSPPRVFDADAARILAVEAGAHNIIIDTNDKDPVSMAGPGRGVTGWLESSSDRGPTAYGLRFVNWMARAISGRPMFPDPSPAKVAHTHGNYAHLGTAAIQDTSRAMARAAEIDRVEAASAPQPTGFFARLRSVVGAGLARFSPEKILSPVHYGRNGRFEPRIIEPETLEKRVNQGLFGPQAPQVVAAEAAPAAKPWWKFW